MKRLTISADAITDILPVGNSEVIQREKTTVVIVSNIDAATLTFGYKDLDGTFHAYEDGEMNSGDDVFNHGVGAPFAVQSSGIGANPVIMEYSL